MVIRSSLTSTPAPNAHKPNTAQSFRYHHNMIKLYHSSREHNMKHNAVVEPPFIHWWPDVRFFVLVENCSRRKWWWFGHVFCGVSFIMLSPRHLAQNKRLQRHRIYNITSTIVMQIFSRFYVFRLCSRHRQSPFVQWIRYQPTVAQSTAETADTWRWRLLRKKPIPIVCDNRGANLPGQIWFVYASYETHWYQILFCALWFWNYSASCGHK